MRTVGLMADPGRASRVARTIGDALAEQLSRDSEQPWQVEVDEQSLPLSPEGEVRLSEHAPHLLESRGWDYLVYVTDLPRFREGRPLLCEMRTRDRAALVLLPALGAVRTSARVRELAVTLVASVAHDVEDPDPRVLAADIGSATVAAAASQPVEGTTSMVLQGPLRLPRLLLGMVRTNRPTRMPRALTGCVAAATATGAFGIFYGSIWTLSDALHPGRLLLINLMVVVALTGWLIVRNRLWNARRDEDVPWRNHLDNTSTLITVGLGVCLMYAGLYAAMVVLGAVVIDGDYLAGQLEHAVGPGDYLELSWLSASLGTLAGALGSNFDSEDAVREATYSARWHERRRLFDVYENDDDEEESG